MAVVALIKGAVQPDADEAGRRRGSAGLEDAREGLFGALGGGAGEALGPGEGSGVSHLLRKTPIGVPIRYGFVE